MNWTKQYSYTNNEKMAPYKNVIMLVFIVNCLKKDDSIYCPLYILMEKKNTDTNL